MKKKTTTTTTTTTTAATKAANHKTGKTVIWRILHLGFVGGVLIFPTMYVVISVEEDYGNYGISLINLTYAPT
jgi:hypothetical protein